jgi:tetratricopeptide (TPR) repeat protein
LSKSCGDVNRQCGVLIDIADITERIGDPRAALIHVTEARMLATFSANLYQEASALWIAAECTTKLGQYQDSIGLLCRAKEIMGICGMVGSLADFNLEMSRAEVHRQKSEYSEARSLNSQILRNTNQDPYFHARALVNIADIDVIIGAPEQEVEQNLGKAKKVFSTGTYPDEMTYCDLVLANLKLREGDTLSAMKLFQDCLDSARGRDNEVVSFALERLADRNYWHVVGCTWPIIYLGHSQLSREKLALHKALLHLGDVINSLGDDDTAHSLFTVAMAGFVGMDVHCSRAQCLMRLGDLANKKGDFSHAIELWEAARPLFEISSQAHSIIQIDFRLAEPVRN